MIEDKETIQERMLKSIDEKYDKTRGSFFYDATKPAAIELEITSEKIKEIQDKSDIENLSGDELERFIYPRSGVSRKHATKSMTIAVISGQEGAKIRKGDLLSTDIVNFVSLEERVIGKSGQTTVIVSCENLGSIGNVPANSINKFPITISGLVDVYNSETVSNGYDEETDNELRQRYYDKLQRPGKAGNKYHYLEWAKEVVGVGNARVSPKWNGPLTVKVIIIDSNRLPADELLIDRVTSHIENERPFGAEVTVVGAIAKEINISVTLILLEGYEESNVKEGIKNNVIDHLKEIAFSSNYVSYAQIGSIILDTEGVMDYSSLKINNGTSNIAIGEAEVAVMGVI